MCIKKEKPKEGANIEGSYKLTVTFNSKKIVLKLNLDDVSFEEAIQYANKLL